MFCGDHTIAVKCSCRVINVDVPDIGKSPPRRVCGFLPGYGLTHLFFTLAKSSGIN